MNSNSKNVYLIFFFLLISNVSYGLGSQCLQFYSSTGLSSGKFGSKKIDDYWSDNWKMYNLMDIKKFNDSKKTDASFFANLAHFLPNLEIQPKALLSSKLFNQEDIEDIAKGKDLLKIKIAQLKDELVKGELDEPRNKKSIRFGKESRSQAKLVGTSARDIELEIENLYGEKARIFANDATGIEGTQSMVKYSLFGDPRIDYYSREAITATMSTLGITKYTADAILANFDQEKRVPLDGSLGVFFSINNPNMSNFLDTVPLDFLNSVPPDFL